jgi:hypothetical protein
MFYNIKRFKETTKLSLYMDSNNHITPNDLKFYEDININDSFYDYLIKFIIHLNC